MPHSPQDARVRQAMALIEMAGFKEVTAREIAEQVGLSEFHFNRLFRAEVGETVTEYIRRHRLDLAAMRLRWTDDDISLVAHDAGYSSQEAFTRAFSARIGKSPRRYRQSVAGWAAYPSDKGAERSIRVRQIESMRCLTRRYIGSYAHVPDFWRSFLETLPEILTGQRNAFYIAFIYDDPQITKPNRIRYDCGIILQREIAWDLQPLLASGFARVETRPGPYACLRQTGSYNPVGRSYSAILDRWLPSQRRYTMADDPALEVHTDPRSLATDQHVEFEVLMPLR